MPTRSVEELAARRVDRKVGVAWALCTLAVLAVTGLMAAGMTVARTAALAHTHVVTATILDLPTSHSDGRHGNGQYGIATIAYTANGKKITERIDVDIYSKPGDTLPLTVDDTGQAAGDSLGPLNVLPLLESLISDVPEDTGSTPQSVTSIMWWSIGIAAAGFVLSWLLVSQLRDEAELDEEIAARRAAGQRDQAAPASS